MGAASAVEFCLIAVAIAIVVWKADRIEQTLELQRAAHVRLESAVQGGQQAERQAAEADVRASQTRLTQEISGLLTALSVIAVGLLLSLGLGLLAVRHYVLRTV